MQIHEEALEGADRPRAPAGCPQCGGCQKLHGHGCYARNASCRGEQRVKIRRFQCPRCGATFGIIPRGMMPYRSVGVEVLEAFMDRRHGAENAASAGGEPRPPPASEVERGCLLRAAKSLLQRIPVLCGLLGQQMPVLGSADIGGFWRALRQLGRLAQILVALAGKFNTSLLGDYGSLLPHWRRRVAPA